MRCVHFSEIFVKIRAATSIGIEPFFSVSYDIRYVAKFCFSWASSITTASMNASMVRFAEVMPAFIVRLVRSGLALFISGLDPPCSVPRTLATRLGRADAAGLPSPCSGAAPILVFDGGAFAADSPPTIPPLVKGRDLTSGPPPRHQRRVPDPFWLRCMHRSASVLHQIRPPRLTSGAGNVWTARGCAMERSVCGHKRVLMRVSSGVRRGAAGAWTRARRASGGPEDVDDRNLFLSREDVARMLTTRTVVVTISYKQQTLIKYLKILTVPL